MWTDTDEGRSFVAELSRTIVAQVAPEELELYEELAQEYFQNPAPPDLSTRSTDDALGFGMNEVLAAASPAALAMTSAVVAFLLDEAVEALNEAAIGPAIKRLFKKKGPDEAPTPSLTKEQLQQVRNLALRQAQTFGMNPTQAESMADALVGSLALSS